jgi:hypothetical protein
MENRKVRQVLSGWVLSVGGERIWVKGVRE